MAPSRPHARIVSVDFGTKRTGLALTDPLRLFPQPLGTFTPDDAIEELRRVEKQHGIDTIVVGWPLTEDDEEGEAVKRVLPYFNRLKKVFAKTTVVKQDERYTSRRAAEALVEAGVRKKGREEKGRLDTAAAVLILQDYLDELES
ncbi:MAG: Holliday junction resolvase RuvX [Rubricoccaceae bacterium]|nr:Holliday junction resolvase RuvX [Rubricoccaceae bacterium]